MNKPLKSVTHGQCKVKPTVTFPVTEHRCPATGTKLYCLVTEAHVCEQLAQGHYLTAEWLGIDLATSRVASQCPNTINTHYINRLHTLWNRVTLRIANHNRSTECNHVNQPMVPSFLIHQQTRHPWRHHAAYTVHTSRRLCSSQEYRLVPLRKSFLVDGVEWKHLLSAVGFPVQLLSLQDLTDRHTRLFSRPFQRQPT